MWWGICKRNYEESFLKNHFGRMPLSTTKQLCGTCIPLQLMVLLQNVYIIMLIYSDGKQSLFYQEMG